MNVKDLRKGDVFWEWESGQSVPFVAVAHPEPLCADSGEILRWKIASYNVVEQKIIEQYQEVNAAAFLYECPLTRPKLAPLMAAFGAAMLHYADIAAEWRALQEG